MTIEEKTDFCFDCKSSFIISVEEQESLLAKGYKNTPKRCPSCRLARKERQLKSGTLNTRQPGFISERKLFPAVCAQCGTSTQVPFEPKEGRPVYCRNCYASVKVNR